MKKKKNLLAWQEILLALLHFWWLRAEGRRLMGRLSSQHTMAIYHCIPNEFASPKSSAAESVPIERQLNNSYNNRNPALGVLWSCATTTGRQRRVAIIATSQITQYKFQWVGILWANPTSDQDKKMSTILF